MKQQYITYSRNPTAQEIKFGYGCQIHGTFAASRCRKPNGKLKTKIKINGQWWTR